MQEWSFAPVQAKALFPNCKSLVQQFSVSRVFKVNRQLVKEAHDFVGLLESASLQVRMLVELRLTTAGSPQTPRKRDPHWEVVVVVLLRRLMT